MALTIAFVLFVVVVLASFVASLRLAEEQLAPAEAAGDATAGEEVGSEEFVIVEGEELIAFDAVPPYAAGYDQWADVVDAAATQAEMTDDDHASVTHDTFDADIVLLLPAPRASGDAGEDPEQFRSEAA